ncbi:glucosaminidase domain-containing protein [Pseudarcicella hirudinis]|uniref:glucosaminidase domain-containing protein n=1 Tax=Pseudarcicella hirudinis TaxID=1079859 RepID=UPI0035ED32F3
MGSGILLLCIVFAFNSASRSNRNGLIAEFPKVAKTGEQILFHFASEGEVSKVRVLANSNSLGIVQIGQNKALLSFKFNFNGVKKLRFIGLNSQNDTVAIVLGELVVGEINKKTSLKTETINPPLYSSTKSTISEPVFKNPVLLNNSNLKFPPTPEEDQVNGRNENVYAKAIGHPGAEEITEFFEDIEDDAMELSKKYTVPASVIMGMAALESGYGFSRPAVYANNIFGIKYWGGNTGIAYQLRGQPDEKDGTLKIIRKTADGQFIYDESNRMDNWYRVYKSRRECLFFLVEEIFLHKTGQWKKDYSDIAQVYKNQISTGISKKEAAYDFLYAIGKRGYTHKGGAYYADRVMKVIDKWKLNQYD